MPEPRGPNIGAADIDRVFREEYGRAVGALVRVFHDIDLVEEAVQDAFTIALARWSTTGPPPSPIGWIITTARHRAIDRVRREASRGDRHAEAMRQHLVSIPDEEGDGDMTLEDDRLRLMFTCCHPALAPAARVALTLRLVAGLTTGEIAHAFLVPEATMAQRLVRAKGKIRDAAIPYRVPGADELPARLPPVLAVIFLVFNEGYTASGGDRLVRDDLAAEAVRLARIVSALLPEQMEAAGLLALLLLIQSRRRARLAADEALVPLAEQDRSLWDRALIDEGRSIVRRCLKANRPGPYQIQAAINAVHSEAATAAETDWRQILQLYDHWLALAPTPVVALNRAVAVAEVEGPAAGLALIDPLPLESYYLWHAVRADLLARLGRRTEAAASYDAALARTANPAERGFLTSRRTMIAAP